MKPAPATKKTKPYEKTHKWSIDRATRKTIRSILYALTKASYWLERHQTNNYIKADLRYINQSILRANDFLEERCHPIGDAPRYKEKPVKLPDHDADEEYKFTQDSYDPPHPLSKKVTMAQFVAMKQPNDPPAIPTKIVGRRSKLTKGK